MVISIPVAFMQRGGRKQIIVPAGADNWQPTATRLANSLIKAVAKAHHWRRLIETGKYDSAAELSKAEGINESYLCRILRLTLLAPDIIEAILDGRQPRTLELQSLLKPLPPDWGAQRKRLALSKPWVPLAVQPTAGGSDPGSSVAAGGKS
ncbi:hypothetical protein [Bradyrhizobium sp. JYMT SZCCT0180]|uniref:hypothetical protein n=1 Tax=Bradyrhizobium sp. JYMT SZCCT0180 TaxID=2807666 RepID=UPI001BAE2907|nr:hypothetical protein [Bradyrhizobium sp. JYMT SZCCT0180]MBR1216209.1 hypothetical protein [Bradyrhizobium sp. JYMT SZCCT0180]